jgi:hypothetical protein
MSAINATLYSNGFGSWTHAPTAVTPLYVKQLILSVKNTEKIGALLKEKKA